MRRFGLAMPGGRPRGSPECPVANRPRASLAHPHPRGALKQFVFDAHIDSLQRVLNDGADLGRFPPGQADLPRWKKGGVGAQVFAVWIDAIYTPRSLCPSFSFFVRR